MEIALGSYTIYFDADISAEHALINWLGKQRYEQIFVLADTHTAELCYPLLRPFLPAHHLIVVAAGESEKNITTCTDIWHKLADHTAGRNALLIDLGGGVIGDMGGFAAATYKRGIDFVQVPTTLLSQVDASVGGKLGIDLDSIKNLVGLFCDPKAVFISPRFLQTLPSRQLHSGFAEMLKHGLISDAAYWDHLASADVQDTTTMMQLIKHSVEIKRSVVEADPFEKGLRKILNFGHTIGHAIESWSMTHDADPLLHGEAIAIGMICEAKLSAMANGLSDTALQEVTNRIMQRYEHYQLEKIPFDALMHAMKLDKKNFNNSIRFSLLRQIGNCDYDVVVSDEQIAEAIHFYSGL